VIHLTGISRQFGPRSLWRDRPGFAGLLAGGLLAALGFPLWAGPADPDSVFGLSRLVGTFLVFLFWAGGLVAWGRLASRRLGLDEYGWLSRLARGSASFSLFAFALGVVKGIGLGRGLPFLIWLVLGYVLNAGLPPRAPVSIPVPTRANPPTSHERWPIGLWMERIGYSVLALGGVFLVIRASNLHGTSDPSMYHLLGPRLWARAGRIAFDPAQPFAYVCSHWENLFLWGEGLLGGPGHRGLIENQLFAQWAHVVLGGGGTLLACRRLFGRFFSFGELLPFALLAALLGGWGPLGLLHLAKNDWGVFCWLLFGVELVFSAQASDGGRWGRLALGGFFLGLSIAGKLNGIFPALAWAGWAVWRDGGRWDREALARRTSMAAVIAAGVAAGLAPVFLRNAIGTGDPFFPFLQGVFGASGLSMPFRLHFAGHEGRLAGLLSPGEWVWKLREFSGEGVFNGIFLIGVPLSFALRGIRRRSLGPWTVFWAASGWLFVLHFERGFLFRWLGSACLWVGPLVLASAAGVVERFPSRASRTLLRVAAVVIALVFLRELGLRQGFTALWQVPANEVARDPTVLTAADSKAWLRMNARPEDRIATTGDNQLYWVSGLRVSSLLSDPAYAALDTDREPRHALEVFEGLGVRYVLDTRFYQGPFWSEVARKLAPVLNSHPDAVLYLGLNSLVFDPARLLRAMGPSAKARGSSEKPTAKRPRLKPG
jgi:hypothetical protein